MISIPSLPAIARPFAPLKTTSLSIPIASTSWASATAEASRQLFRRLLLNRDKCADSSLSVAG
jgi:hypothetical protein